MPRRNFREIDTNSSDWHFSTGDRFSAEVNRSSCLRVNGVDLLPAERLTLDWQCPSQCERTWVVLGEYKWSRPFKWAWVEVLYVYVIWQVIRFLKPESICKFGGRIQLEEGRASDFGKWNCEDKVLRSPSDKQDEAEGTSTARTSLKPCLPEGICAIAPPCLRELPTIRPDWYTGAQGVFSFPSCALNILWSKPTACFFRKN